MSSDKISISNIQNACSLDQKFLEYLKSEFKYYRAVEKNDIFYAVAFNYFENLCSLNNEHIIKFHKDMLSDVNVLSIKDQKLKTCLKEFLKNPRIGVLELIRNYFELFVQYIYKLMVYTLKSKTNKTEWEFLSSVDPGILNSIFQGNKDVEFKDSIIKLMACTTGTQIRIYDTEWSSYVFYDPIAYQNSKTCINLLRMPQNEYLILYSSQDQEFYDKIEESLVLSAETEYKQNTVNFNNCLVCYNEVDSPLSCGDYIHVQCIKRKKLKKCEKCNNPITLDCSICKINKPVEYICSNSHATCIKCIILQVQTFSTSDLCKFVCCKENISLPRAEFECIGCKELRYCFDFVIINCVSFHEFLCKKCWSEILCQVNNQKIIQNMGIECACNNNKKNIVKEMIEKYFNVLCVRCSQLKIKFFSDKVCKSNEKVCVPCQASWNQKESNPSCAKCETPLIKRTRAWDI